MNKEKCPGCNANPDKQEKLCIWQIYRCQDCGAIHGNCRQRESYIFVLPQMIEEEVPDERQKYFDFTCYDSPDGSIRRHGWFDIETRKIVQIG